MAQKKGTVSNGAFAEVVESSLDGFVAQSWQWDSFPAFGSVVSVLTKKRTLCAIVHQIKTGSQDPARYPIAYQKTEEELRTEQPQIFSFLRTTFSCITVGYVENDRFFYVLPPEPAKIHAFVCPMAEQESRQFFSSNKFLDVLFNLSGQVLNIDELLLAVLAYQRRLNLFSTDRFTVFLRHFSLLIGNDYRRLRLFVQRAESIISV